MEERIRTSAGKMIREARMDKGWTQRELGKMLGYDYGNFIGMIENGNSILPIDKIPIISEILGLNPKKLLKEVMLCKHPGVARYI
ncbi:MAG: helix-turn-helix transcriptional regulator [Desulfobacteraceae bacterium]|nr:helix-turn-helix transcriptional regulator [Desulfobacteraceae bacterium]MBC2750097.1 helix-turn-helix transcriptional regulator [Desulfobacteraceae bacterium]